MVRFAGLNKHQTAGLQKTKRNACLKNKNQSCFWRIQYNKTGKAVPDTIEGVQGRKTQNGVEDEKR